MSEQVNRANEVQPSAKPQLFVKSLTFNDGTSLNLTPNSIVVLLEPIIVVKVKY